MLKRKLEAFTKAFCVTIIKVIDDRDTVSIVKNRIIEIDITSSWRKLYEETITKSNTTDSVNDGQSSRIISVLVFKQINSKDNFEPDLDQPIELLLDFDENLKFVHFKINITKDESLKNEPVQSTSSNIFAQMMQNRNKINQKPKLKDQLNNKDKLYNDLVTEMDVFGAFFPTCMPSDTVKRHMPLLVNVL